MAVTVRTLENFIGGEWVPSTGESARAVAAARAAQPKWAALSAWGRAKICHAIADLIDERREDFASELSLEQGKPYAAEALGDIDETAENFRIAAEDVKRMETAIVPSQDVGKRILTFRKPNGVYAGITPWNFPTLIPVATGKLHHASGSPRRSWSWSTTSLAGGPDAISRLAGV